MNNIPGSINSNNRNQTVNDYGEVKVDGASPQFQNLNLSLNLSLNLQLNLNSPLNIHQLFSNNSNGDVNTTRYKKDICKSFEDDLLYCPRFLLSKQEQQLCEKVDEYTLDLFMELQKQATRYNQPTVNDDNNLSMNPNLPKFNPYMSQSFNPLTLS